LIRTLFLRRVSCPEGQDGVTGLMSSIVSAAAAVSTVFLEGR
jgi:hypothetical protein